MENKVGGGKNKNGIYYSIKNLRKNTTDFFLSQEIYIDIQNIQSLIYEWRGSANSYIFLYKYGKSIFRHEDDRYSTTNQYQEWLYNTYKQFCLNHNLLSNLYKIMEFNRQLGKEHLEELLEEYIKIKSRSGEYNRTISFFSPECVLNIRDLQLKILLYDQNTV